MAYSGGVGQDRKRNDADWFSQGGVNGPHPGIGWRWTARTGVIVVSFFLVAKMLLIPYPLSLSHHSARSQAAGSGISIAVAFEAIKNGQDPNEISAHMDRNRRELGTHLLRN